MGPGRWDDRRRTGRGVDRLWQDRHVRPGNRQPSLVGELRWPDELDLDGPRWRARGAAVSREREPGHGRRLYPGCRWRALALVERGRMERARWPAGRPTVRGLERS